MRPRWRKCSIGYCDDRPVHRHQGLAHYRQHAAVDRDIGELPVCTAALRQRLAHTVIENFHYRQEAIGVDRLDAALGNMLHLKPFTKPRIGRGTSRWA